MEETSNSRSRRTTLKEILQLTSEYNKEICEKESSVSGVLCTDSKGLCLGTTGKLHSELSGVISSLTSAASLLDPSSNTEPIIVIHSEDSKLLIKKQEDISVAIIKDIPNSFLQEDKD
ncbi:LAMTOR5 [Lepeophtheirus salmonis]|uniref:Late endosomal/lysosomal adaptor and MAPK and MTOR activator 5 n=1 Tax=Lepeophtheirus salmonis TaxID=72036 RepID=A0A7R8CZJ7_LEPSM|nr:LAMTOR5 [Lepeophtheirus salmonis]CAF2950664.1 LAMTOR5 [Lepeophtheirus salmonis]